MLTWVIKVEHSRTTQECETFHAPRVHAYVLVVLVVLRAAVIHDFHFPTRREVSGDDLHVLLQLKSMQVLDGEKRVSADVLDDKTGATRMELPLHDSGPLVQHLCISKNADGLSLTC
jgi:hypothetical protein